MIKDTIDRLLQGIALKRSPSLPICAFRKNSLRRCYWQISSSNA